VNLTLSYNIKGLSINKALDTIMLAKSSFYKFIRTTKLVILSNDSNSSNEIERKAVNVEIKSKRGRKVSEFTNRIINIGKDNNNNSSNSSNSNKDSSNKEVIISVPDTVVKDDIKYLLSKEFVCYGYKKVAKYLKKYYGYIINSKKVYRLMKEMSLLLPKTRPASIDIERVKNRKVHLVRPNELWQIDIKYLYIHGEKRNSYVCTIIDCFTKEAIVFYHGKHCLNENIKTLFEEALIKRNIINLRNYQLISGNGGNIDKVKLNFYNKLNFDKTELRLSLNSNENKNTNTLTNNLTLTIRSDNGSQFSAKNVYNYLMTLSIIGVNHERIHVVTPEEDGYIESFHSIMHNEFETKYEFDTFEEQRDYLLKWFVFYNNKRIHSAIDYCTPSEFYNQYMENVNSDKNEVYNKDKELETSINDKKNITDKNIAINYK
jgi:putative transposase